MNNMNPRNTVFVPLNPTPEFAKVAILALHEILINGPVTKTVGICANLNAMLFDLPESNAWAYSIKEPCVSPGYAVVSRLCSTWNNWSGSTVCPIKSYANGPKKWQGEQLEQRNALMVHLVNELKKSL